MPAAPKPHPAFDLSVLDLLACPACQGPLRMENGRILCAGCGRAYPIVDGIPVLIVERAASSFPS